ncbi:uncharacterized protein LOC130896752 isoform X1 [Diorhabda carinulata]|uniref:uncharacterized protein LOC130896752 isoform X1 n=2 Tax=Diorhabda carinulata TaxID=1163345 RepID=UPI0025A115E1|nr:uncharacterized protein LOC130896752 isoform X1 [Diorhabda carinulata]
MSNNKKQKDCGYYQLSIFTTFREEKQLKSITRSMKRKMNPKLRIYVILRYISKAYRKVMAAASFYMNKRILEILDMILPQEYFGSSQNRKRFYFIVNKIMTQSRGECIFKHNLYDGFDLECINWLPEATDVTKRQKRYLSQTNWYILEQIVKPLIRNFYFCLKSIKSYEIQFIPFKKWNKFQANIFKSLIINKHLIHGKFSNPRGSLQLFPRGDLNQMKYRPIVRANKLNQIQKIRITKILRKIQQLALSFSKSSSQKELTFWKKCTEQLKSKTLYGITVDIEDAYGNVNINKLCQAIIETKFEQEEKSFLINHIQNQHVTFYKKIFKWSHGLLQGDHLSPCLCNLYLSILEHQHLSNFIETNYRLHRVVDDYLFCTTDISEIELFKRTFQQLFPINESKIQTANVDDCPLLIYCGKEINFATKQISKHFDAEETCLRHKFKLWNDKVPKTKAEIITAAVSFRRTYHYFKHFQLSDLRDTAAILTQYFKGMVYVAFKFDMTVRSVADFRQKSSDMPFLLRLIKDTITTHAKKVYHYLRNEFDFKLLRTIAKKAFIVVLKKNSCFYKDIISSLCLNKPVYIHLKNADKNLVKYFTKIPIEFQKLEMKRTSKI